MKLKKPAGSWFWNKQFRTFQQATKQAKGAIIALPLLNF